MELSKKDYIKILNYYKIPISKNYKQDAEKILGTKLCKCIKHINTKEGDINQEKKAIAICNNAVFKKRNLKNVAFSCKKKSKLMSTKKFPHKIYKTKKSITLKKKK